ncbi:L,D-transpeptidase [Labedaea rhizosphaerae]|uniref:L,D-transpeptidase n=1 Tax=Labedaea rhizosphaerae TaxID=598644 RepID=UPI001AAD0843|nr:Ig-like domain-containing protein [Labedaea rhizosphaerae]
MTVGRGTRRFFGAVAAAAAASLVFAACSSDDGGAPATQTQTGAAGQNQQVGPAAAPVVAKVTTKPANNAKNVAPNGPFTVTVADGTLASVTLTNPDGKKVKGSLAADKKSWKVTEDLGYGKKYTWSGSATSPDGKSVPVKGSFTTVTAQSKVSAHINTADNATYGVGQPIVVTFDQDVSDKKSVEKALKVETSKDVTGSWAWFDDRTVHYRPKAYWPANTKVDVHLDIYGVSFGGGAYGLDDVTSKFTIGRNQVVKANTKTHRFMVYRNGKKVHDYPASYGLDSDPGRVTHSGTHLVMSKSQTYFMTNEKYDYENIEVHWAVRISNNGEFVHGAPWSAAQQGNSNVSHGCANLSEANAEAYYNSVLPGDPVEVTGSTVKLSPADGDYHDWIYSWSKWQSMSAL